jgi:hypothetical protein
MRSQPPWGEEFQPLGAAVDAPYRRGAGGKANLLCSGDERGDAARDANAPAALTKWWIVIIVPPPPSLPVSMAIAECRVDMSPDFLADIRFPSREFVTGPANDISRLSRSELPATTLDWTQISPTHLRWVFIPTGA